MPFWIRPVICAVKYTIPDRAKPKYFRDPKTSHA